MERNNLIKKCAFFSFIVILFLIVCMLMLRYEVEGEKTLPYELNKILIISTVDGEFVEDSKNLWNIGVTQTNDVYIYIEAKNKTEDLIKQVVIENFNLTKKPEKGNVVIYRPTGDLPNLYTYSEQNYLEDKIIYKGSSIDDMKALEIANNGGVLGFRLSLNNLGSFISNEETEIIYDGRLLSNIGISLEEINLSLSFDIIIETESNIKYKGTVKLNMPAEDITKEGSSNIEITDFSEVIFKRI